MRGREQRLSRFGVRGNANGSVVSASIVAPSLLPHQRETPPRARANGGDRSERKMSGIPTAIGISQYVK